MINTKFYVHEEVVLPKGASGLQLKNYTRKQISLKEAEGLDRAYGEELEVLDASYPEIQKSFNELDAEVVKAAMEVNALLTARSPDLAAAQTALRMLVYSRDMPKRDYSLKRTELFAKRQALTRPVVVDTLAEWRARRIALSENISIDEVEEIQHLFDKSEVRIKSNRRSLKRVLDFLIRKEAEVRVMINTSSLSEILDFIKVAEKEYEGFDPTLCEYEKMDETEHRLLREAQNELKTPAKNPITTYFAGKDSILVSVNDGLYGKEKSLTDRFEGLKKRIK